MTVVRIGFKAAIGSLFVEEPFPDLYRNSYGHQKVQGLMPLLLDSILTYQSHVREVVYEQWFSIKISFLRASFAPDSANPHCLHRRGRRQAPGSAADR